MCVIAAQPAAATAINLNSQSCQDFLASSADNVRITLAWLEGYYQDDDAPPIIDFDQMKADGAKLQAYCTKHPALKLGVAAETLFGLDH